MSENIKSAQNVHHLPSACDLLRMPAQAVGLDGRAENKQKKLRMLSTHREGFGNGNNESYSPKYFILHLK
jgi:hypothetical protein